MKRWMYGLLVLGTFALTGASALAASQASDPKDQCKGGGFAAFVDPNTGQPFRNQGQCVSHVARGGALVPVVTPTPTPTLPGAPNLAAAVSCRSSMGPQGAVDICLATVTNVGSSAVILPAGTQVLWSQIIWLGFPAQELFTILSISPDVPAGYEVFTGATFCAAGPTTCSRTTVVETVAAQTRAPGARFTIEYTYQGDASVAVIADLNRVIENETSEADNVAGFGPF